MKQILQVTLDLAAESPGAQILAVLDGRESSFPTGPLAKGLNTLFLHIPENKKPVRAKFVLQAAGEVRVFESVLRPQRKWTIDLLHHSHTDIGYTELQTRISKKHAEYLDEVIEYCRQTADYPDEAKFRWNCEVAWSVENYIRQRPPEKVRELMDLIKAGRVEVGAWYLQLSDCFAHEQLVRAVYFARELVQRYGIPLTSAMNNDVTGWSWASPQILSQAGVRYFATGINETRSLAALRRPCAFYWESPDRSRVLHWNGEHYLFANYELKIHEGKESSFPKIMAYLRTLEDRGDYPYELIALNISAYVTDNCPPGRNLPDLVRDWNERYAFPKLRLATMREFFEAFEGQYKGRIPVHRKAWPDYWTDGVASTAFETGLNRITHDELLSAEFFDALARSVNPSYSVPRADFGEAYSQSMLYDEHTWGAYNSIDDPDSELARSQWTLKSSFAYVARELSRTLREGALSGIAASVRSEEPLAFAVFNPLSWERTDLVTVSLPASLAERKGKFVITDNRTGRETAFQLLDDRTLLIAAVNVPSMGYAVFTVQPDREPAAAPGNFIVQDGQLEGEHFRLAVDPVTGGLKSLFDKGSGIELVDGGSPYVLNQYIYENPVGGRKAVDNMEQRAMFERSSPASVALAPGLQGPVAASLIVKASAKMCAEMEMRYILYKDLKRIDIVNVLNKEETRTPEAVYFAYPFNVAGGVFTFEIADAAMRPEADQLPRSVRDWYTIQDWVEAANGKLSVVWSPLEAPLVQFGDINTGKWLKRLDVMRASVFSYAMNNYWMTNFKAGQGGRVVFRFALTSRPGGTDVVSSTRFGREVHHPLAAVWLKNNPHAVLPGTAHGFLQVDRPNVLIQAVKQAEDGRGFIVRLREIAGEDGNVRVASPLFKEAGMSIRLTDIAEKDLGPLPLSEGTITVPIKKFGIVTFRCVPSLRP